MGRRQRSTTVTIVGLSVVSGSASSRRWRPRAHSRRAFNRQQPRQSPSLGERLKKGEFEEAIGRSRGGRTSKIHALADDRGRPVAFALTPGNVADVVMAVPLLGAVAHPSIWETESLSLETERAF